MTKPADQPILRTKSDKRPKKTWRAPRMLTCLPVAQTANSKTYTPNDSYVNPNVS